MRESVDLNSAINIGLKRSHIAFVTTFFAGLAVLFVLQIYFAWHAMVFLALTALPIALAFYVNAQVCYAWQLWALERVDNGHALEKIALKRGMIWNWDDRLFKPGRETREKICRLRPKGQPSEEMPILIPDKVEIYYSKGYNSYQLIVWSLVFLGLTYFAVTLYTRGGLGMDEPGNTVIWIAVGIFLFFTFLMVIENVSQLLYTGPAIIFSSEGIRIKKKILLPSNKIEEVIFWRDKHGSFFKVMLEGVPLGFPKEITDMSMDRETMEEISKVFIERWKSQR